MLRVMVVYICDIKIIMKVVARIVVPHSGYNHTNAYTTLCVSVCHNSIFLTLNNYKQQ